MDIKNVSKFTCKVCGGHRMIVTHIWTILAGPESERWQEWGYLKDDLHWKYEFTEKIEEISERVAQRGDFGEYEEDDSASEPEEFEINETETSRESDDFFVNCENCDHEIEFGWSEPDRRGLIWPVESSDFVAVECWPDPKYTDLWQSRHWLRTGSIRA